MGKLMIGQKASRVIEFLVGLRHRRIAGILSTVGFGRDDLKEGWDLARALTDGRLNATPLNVDPDLILELDDWENYWFPIANATLRSRFPDDHATLFKNLTQTEGVAVVTSVGTFVSRLDSLSDPAKKRLKKRGLSDEVIAKANEILKTLGQPEEPDSGDLDSAEDEARMTALWNWYLEWSEIARATIDSPKLLRLMGFLKPDGSDDDDLEDEAKPPAAPGAPVVTPPTPPKPDPTKT